MGLTSNIWEKTTSLKLIISLALILPTGCVPAVESVTSLQLTTTMPVVDNPTQVVEAGTFFDNQPVIDIKGFAFNPQTVTIKVGTQITWTSSDSAAHTATASDLGFDSGLLKKGESFTFEFN
jgi:plastocyanin